MYSVSPGDVERFHLRILLLHCPGAQSFEDLRTVDGTLAETFKEACALRNLIQDDTEWDQILAKSVAFEMPYQL